MNVRRVSLRPSHLLLAIALGGVGTVACANVSNDRVADTQPERCLDLARIRDTEIIDGKRVLFKTTGKEMYLNELPHACPGLRPNEPYLVRSNVDRLCNLDTITMLYRGGFGFTPGATCGLGMFQPVTQAQVDMVKAEIAHPAHESR